MHGGASRGHDVQLTTVGLHDFSIVTVSGQPKESKRHFSSAYNQALQVNMSFEALLNFTVKEEQDEANMYSVDAREERDEEPDDPLWFITHLLDAYNDCLEVVCRAARQAELKDDAAKWEAMLMRRLESASKHRMEWSQAIERGDERSECFSHS